MVCTFFQIIGLTIYYKTYWIHDLHLRISLRNPIDFHLFKMSCLTCLVFSCVYWFFLNRWNYAKICMNKPYLCRNFFLTDWRHKRLKNTIDLLLFYGENFYGFSESDIFKTPIGWSFRTQFAKLCRCTASFSRSHFVRSIVEELS